MRRRIVLSVAGLAAVVGLLAGCGGGDDDSGADTASTGGTEETATEPGVAVSCADYERVLQLFAQTEEIATGSFDGQTQADLALADALAELGRSAEGDDALSAALDTLGQVSFQVSTSDTAGPRPEEVDAALDALTEAWGGGCRPAAATSTTLVEAGPDDTVSGDGTIECPAPEALGAEDDECDGGLPPGG